ncbi:YaiI/YqxD family protein [Parahaliea mediterranea]|uniref:YaiI/YqxD family protein n=1 Tax=Parahaliea mediterranea TaxID=651086 RepID=UPI000E2EA6F5|nr:YaiI/YqxD family protein [Parahaliea mediterranea]
MHIWVDADACPVAIKEILFRAAQRTGIGLTLVANHAMQVPKAPNIRFVQVERGFDVADNLIVGRAEAGDLVVTADIPLAAEVVEKGACGLSPRGERYTADNIRARLNMRDFMATLRDSGVETGGAAPLSQADRQLFANRLDQMLARAR